MSSTPHDLVDQINAVHREVRDAKTPSGEGRTVLIRRTYDTSVEDVWDAITTPERLARWFRPVSGDLRVGGRYQLEGQAGGEILRCEPPSLLRVSWIFGEPKEDDFSEVEVRLTADGDARTQLELQHVAKVDPEFWGTYGPGAVGVGWDLGLTSLSLYLAGRGIDPAEGEAWQASPEAVELTKLSSASWGRAYAAWGASEEEATTTARNTLEFYAPGAE
ncbi:SRPBCC family protein [Streptomyces sp. NPDC002851]